MTTNSNSGPGKTRHLNDIAACCEAMGMRVICVNAAERDFWLSASQQSAPALDGKAGISQHIMQRQRGHCLFLGKAGSGMSVTKQQMRFSWRSLTSAGLKRCTAERTGRGWRRLSDTTAASGFR